MGISRDDKHTSTRQDKLLDTLEQLLSIEATELKDTMDQAADRLADALGAEKIDISLHEPSTDTLVAFGISNTPMGRRQQEIGMDRVPVANGGRVVEVFQTGQTYLTGRADEDPGVLVGFTQGLGIQSFLLVPLVIGGKRRGVLQACSSRADIFTEEDQRFMQAVSRWVGMVAHRAELSEQIARDAAEAARRTAADEVATVLAHDLNNHLTPLTARVDLIRRRAERLGDTALTEHANEARFALRRLRNMVSGMLDVARLDQGLFALSLQPVDLAHLVRDVAGVFKVRRDRIEVRVPEELVVQADPDALRQALENLVANAIKHSAKGIPVTLDVSEEETESGRNAVITVRDGGPGIPPEIMPRLFDRFASGPSSEGLGLGLYLARGIADAHGGTLTVESELGQGTAFRLSLPTDR